MHAAFDFAVSHPGPTAAWHRDSNTLVLLAAADELRLGWLLADALAAGLRAVAFHEPDRDGELTAVAFEPAAARLLTHLPLALRREVNHDHDSGSRPSVPAR